MREQGIPGARCTRGLVCKSAQKNAHEHTGSAEAIRHSPRNGFTAYFVLSPATGLSCHRRLRSCLRKLDASVGASGPHDFAVRVSAIRQRRRRVHRLPLRTSVTIAKRPSLGTGSDRYIPVLFFRQQLFLKFRNLVPGSDRAKYRLALREANSAKDLSVRMRVRCIWIWPAALHPPAWHHLWLPPQRCSRRMAR
jgi:hypothetical protein